VTHHNAVWYRPVDRFCNTEFPDSDVTGSFPISRKDDVDWIDLAQDKDKWRAVLNTA